MSVGEKTTFSVCVGIVTYNPDREKLSENLKAITPQCRNVVLIDNASSNLDEVTAIKDEFGAELIALDQNYGIAKALNVLMQYAREHGYLWALSLDQDSVVAPNIMSEYEKNLALPNLAALCPKTRKRNAEDAKDNGADPVESVDRCPTTGFLCSVRKFFETDGYDEWMFIDYVDYDICMKLKLCGGTIFRVNTTYVLQDLGNMSVNRPLNRFGERIHSQRIKNMSVTFNHSPTRNYYYVRNSLYYIQKYKDYMDKRLEHRKIVKWELKKILLEKQKRKTMRSIMTGVKDYKKKKI